MPKIPSDPDKLAEFERQLREEEKRTASQMRQLIGSRQDQVERLDRMAGLRP